MLPDTEADVYACTKKQKMTARNGSPYLSVELRDASGKIGARAFQDASFLEAQFDRGDIAWPGASSRSRISARSTCARDQAC